MSSCGLCNGSPPCRKKYTSPTPPTRARSTRSPSFLLHRHRHPLLVPLPPPPNPSTPRSPAPNCVFGLAASLPPKRSRPHLPPHQPHRYQSDPAPSSRHLCHLTGASAYLGASASASAAAPTGWAAIHLPISPPARASSPAS